MSVIDFQESLQARIARLANRQLSMQEALPNVPRAELTAYLNELERLSDELSRLAGRLDDDKETRRQGDTKSERSLSPLLQVSLDHPSSTKNPPDDDPEAA